MNFSSFIEKYKELILYSSALAIVSLLLASFYFDGMRLILLLSPIAIIGILAGLINIKIIYFVLIALLPVSSTLFFPGNLALDIPTEPFMIVFMIIIPFWFFSKDKIVYSEFLFHPITTILLLSLIWLIPNIIYSEIPLFSVKFLIAKLWYVTTFYFGTSIFINNTKDFKSFFWAFFIPLVLIVLVITVRYATYNFSFEYMNEPLAPFFKNHVIFSTFLATLLPFIIVAFNWKENSKFAMLFLLFGLVIIVFNIIFAYTRATWLSLPVAGIMYFIIQKKLITKVLTISTVITIFTVYWFLHDNRYLDYAPDYATTVYHRGNLEGHLEATMDGSDVSGMERVYRWVAAKNMFYERPIVGFGTNCFYDNYRKYTVEAFATYVSDNTDKSTTHNYFIMVLVEQGLVGLLLFSMLLFGILIYGTKMYHKVKNIQDKNIIMACLLSLTIIAFHLLLNDLIETDKIGSFFFISIAIILKVVIWNKANVETYKKES